MAKVGLLVRLEAKPGHEAEVEAFLHEGLGLALNEPGTSSWYALKFGERSFGIFDTFAEEDGRAAHLSGPIAQALLHKAPLLLAQAPQIEMLDVLAEK